eukprot:511644-Prymnesium_polylepis.1
MKSCDGTLSSSEVTASKERLPCGTMSTPKPPKSSHVMRPGDTVSSVISWPPARTAKYRLHHTLSGTLCPPLCLGVRTSHGRGTTAAHPQCFANEAQVASLFVMSSKPACPHSSLGKPMKHAGCCGAEGGRSGGCRRAVSGGAEGDDDSAGGNSRGVAEGVCGGSGNDGRDACVGTAINGSTGGAEVNSGALASACVQ